MKREKDKEIDKEYTHIYKKATFTYSSGMFWFLVVRRDFTTRIITITRGFGILLQKQINISKVSLVDGTL